MIQIPRILIIFMTHSERVRQGNSCNTPQFQVSGKKEKKSYFGDGYMRHILLCMALWDLRPVFTQESEG